MRTAPSAPMRPRAAALLLGRALVSPTPRPLTNSHPLLGPRGEAFGTRLPCNLVRRIAEMAASVGNLRDRSLQARQAVRDDCNTLETTSAVMDTNAAQLGENNTRLRQQLKSMSSSTCLVRAHRPVHAPWMPPVHAYAAKPVGPSAAPPSERSAHRTARAAACPRSECRALSVAAQFACTAGLPHAPPRLCAVHLHVPSDEGQEEEPGVHRTHTLVMSGGGDP